MPVVCAFWTLESPEISPKKRPTNYNTALEESSKERDQIFRNHAKLGITSKPNEYPKANKQLLEITRGLPQGSTFALRRLLNINKSPEVVRKTCLTRSKTSTTPLTLALCALVRLGVLEVVFKVFLLKGDPGNGC